MRESDGIRQWIDYLMPSVVASVASILITTVEIGVRYGTIEQKMADTIASTSRQDELLRSEIGAINMRINQGNLPMTEGARTRFEDMNASILDLQRRMSQCEQRK